MASFSLVSLEQPISHSRIGPGCAQAGCIILGLVLALTSFLGWFLSCHCYGPADWFDFKSIRLRRATLLGRRKNRALKIFFKAKKLTWPFTSSIAPMANWNSGRQCSLQWHIAESPSVGQGRITVCLCPFESTRLWLRTAEASGETGSLCSYCIPHGEIVPSLHNVGSSFWYMTGKKNNKKNHPPPV